MGGGGVHPSIEKVKPFVEILKLKGSFVDISVILATSAFAGEVDERIILIILSGMLIHSGSDIYNDIYDREIDRICKPQAPITSGRMSIKTAWIYLSSLTLIALCISLILSRLLFLCYVAGIIFGYIFYSHPKFRFKDRPVVAILTIAFCFSLESLGAWSVYSPVTRKAMIVAVYIFILIFSLVFMKDFKDVEGDVNSLPLLVGVRRAAILCSLLAFLPFVAMITLVAITRSIILLSTAFIFLFIVLSCIKILLFDNPVAYGKKLRNRMILSISLPNISIFILTFYEKIAQEIPF